MMVNSLKSKKHHSLKSSAFSISNKKVQHNSKVQQKQTQLTPDYYSIV